ncbi:unnamed protein product [Protopolystoma xenopodis]|uniref:Uncharacterized protein n=1 Tax=Protopolystoma xenopodis TaxID=117903 RepID=A0A448XKN0_9PLAT|nr:unnamed protein product [Protopolystoma xenopodis]
MPAKRLGIYQVHGLTLEVIMHTMDSVQGAHISEQRSSPSLFAFFRMVAVSLSNLLCDLSSIVPCPQVFWPVRDMLMSLRLSPRPSTAGLSALREATDSPLVFAWRFFVRLSDALKSRLKPSVANISIRSRTGDQENFASDGIASSGNLLTELYLRRQLMIRNVGQVPLRLLVVGLIPSQEARAEASTFANYFQVSPLFEKFYIEIHIRFVFSVWIF